MKTYTFSEVAKILNVKTTVVNYQVVQKKIVPSKKKGGKYFITQDSLNKLKAELNSSNNNRFEIKRLLNVLRVDLEVLNKLISKNNIEVKNESVSSESAIALLQNEMEKIKYLRKVHRKQVKSLSSDLARVRKVVNHEKETKSNKDADAELKKERHQLRNALFDKHAGWILLDFFSNAGGDLIMKRIKALGHSYQETEIIIKGREFKGLMVSSEAMRVLDNYRNRI